MEDYRMGLDYTSVRSKAEIVDWDKLTLVPIHYLVPQDIIITIIKISHSVGQHYRLLRCLYCRTLVPQNACRQICVRLTRHLGASQEQYDLYWSQLGS